MGGRHGKEACWYWGKEQTRRQVEHAATVSAIAEVLERRHEVVPEIVRVQVLHHRRDSLANELEAIATVWG